VAIGLGRAFGVGIVDQIAVAGSIPLVRRVFCMVVMTVRVKVVKNSGGIGATWFISLLELLQKQRLLYCLHNGCASFSSQIIAIASLVKAIIIITIAIDIFLQ
jgi:hypothetical protein